MEIILPHEKNAYSLFMLITFRDSFENRFTSPIRYTNSLFNPCAGVNVRRLQFVKIDQNETPDFVV